MPWVSSRTQNRASIPGARIWAGLGLAQFALLAGTYSHSHLLPVVFFAVSTLIAYLGRLFLVLRKNYLYPQNPRAWRIGFWRMPSLLLDRMGTVQLLQPFPRWIS